MPLEEIGMVSRLSLSGNFNMVSFKRFFLWQHCPYLVLRPLNNVYIPLAKHNGSIMEADFVKLA